VPTKTLKIIAGLVVAHWLLLFLLQRSVGATAYQLGQVTGQLIFVGIVVYALLRVAKYGWGVSLFIMTGTLIRELRLLMTTLHNGEDSAQPTASLLLFLAVNAPLMVAIVLMFRDASRAPFRLKYPKK